MTTRLKSIPAKFLVNAAIGLMVATGLSATTIAGFTFDIDLNPTTEGSNVTVSALGSGSGFAVARSSTDGGNAFIRTSVTGLNDLAAAITDNDYVSFTVTPGAGVDLDLTSLSLRAGYTNSGSYTSKILTQAVLTDIDGFTAAASLGSVSTANTSTNDGTVVYQTLNIDLTAAQFQDITTATEFRIYLSDDTNNAGIIHRIDDIVLSGTVTAPPAPRPAQPNLLLILADDLGWQDIKVYDQLETDVVNGFGGTNVFETNQMDALAAEGVMFTNAYSPTPVCAPSRVAIMTGKHPARVDVTMVDGGRCPKASSVVTNGITPHFRSSLKDEEYSLAEALRDAGYYTGAFGKWHMSPDGHHYSFPYPTDQGFDVAYNSRGVQSSMSSKLTGFATTDPSDTYQLDGNGIATDPVTEETLGFFADAVSRQEPFFCYYSTWLVHTPIQMRTESLLQKYAGLMGYDYPLDGTEIFAEGQNNPYYAAMVESLDYYISKLIDYLETTDDPRWPGHKLIENTYIILTSDNGGYEGADNGTDNFPLDEGKLWLQEGGVRVPFIAMGPGISSNTLSDVIINGMDIYPTFLSLAGASIPSGLDASDLSPLLLNDPLDSAQVTDSATNTERASMFWHFPHSGRNATTMLKDGWKLYKKYTSSLDKYSLYQLYDANGDAVDINEQVDVKASYPQVLTEMSAELDAWMEEVQARPLYWNPERLILALGDQSPKILSTGNDETMAWVTWNTNQAKVKFLDLLYCKNPGNDYEEWFKIPVPFDHEDGWAEVEIPEGAQSYLFNLIDENFFFYSSVYLTGHSGKASTAVPLRTWEPQGVATFADAGTVYPSYNVLLGNTVGSLQNAVRDDGTNLQVLGQTFTVSEPVSLSALTLQAFTNFSIGSSDAAELYLWIGQYESGAPADDPYRTRLYQEIDMRGVSCTAGNYYTIDFEDTVLTSGTYAFQLKWKEQATGNLCYWMRSDGDGAYAGGDLIHLQTTAGASINWPFAATETAGDDLVFALHGTIDHFGGWTTENGLDRIPEEDGRLSTVGPFKRVQKNNVFYNKWASTEWTVVDGVIASSSAVNSRLGEGPIAICIDLTDLPETDHAQLSLSFDYTTADSAEKLYAHLWGCVDLDPSENPEIMHLGGNSGSAWTAVSSDQMEVYNLGRPDGVFTGTAGTGSDAAVPGLTGSVGAQAYSNTFDLSTFTTAPDAVTDYDYIVLGFAREVGGTTSPSVSITNIRLSIEGGPTLHEFPLSQVDPTTPEGDPDGDGRSNLYEYGIGGDPNKKSNVGAQPVLDMSGASGEFCYPRRRDAVARKLTYQVVGASDLTTPDWSTDGISETGTAVIDDDFEEVVNSVPTGASSGFFRVEIELAE